MKNFWIPALLAGITILTTNYASAATSAHFEIDTDIIGSGADAATSANYQLQDVLPYVDGDDGIFSSGDAPVMPTLSAVSGSDFAEINFTWTAVQNIPNATYELGLALSSSPAPTYTDYTYDSPQSSLSKKKDNLSFTRQFSGIIRVRDGLGEIVGYSNAALAIPQSFVAGNGNTGGGGGGGGADYSRDTARVFEFIAPGTAPTSELSRTIPIEQLVPKIAPLVFQARWNLWPKKSIESFVFQGLPKPIADLARKFPQIAKLFSEAGITKLRDLSKLRSVSLNIPGLSDVLALPSVRIPGTNLSVPSALRISELSAEIKAKLPSGIVFTRLAGGTIDLLPSVRITEDGWREETISVLAGRDLHFAIKPEFPARRIYGLVILKDIPRQSTGMLDYFIPTAHAQTIDTALVLHSFEYSDADGDGIYTADIRTPIAAGNYEIDTVIEYQDPHRGTSIMRLTTIVDPEGYVYELVNGKEIVIPGADVALEWLNPQTTKYELWPATAYSQKNPQTTSVTGQYSFLVPEGMYRLTVQASGYAPYDGEPFVVRTGVGVHQNIPLKASSFSFARLDWKMLIVIIIGLAVIINFWKDRKIRSKENIK